MQSERAAALSGKDEHVCHPGVDRSFYALGLGQERCSVVVKGFTLATDKGVEKVKRGKFPGRCPACKEDIFTTFDW